MAALNKGGEAQVSSVSCASAGNCSAGGYYQDARHDFQAFVVGERNGAWGRAEEIPGTGALNTGGGLEPPDAHVNSLSCGSAGNCSAGGYYTDDSGDRQAFIATQTDGTWGQAEEVPGTAALNQGGDDAQAISVSCASAGNCSAAGYYTDSNRNEQAFVAGETNGTWGKAHEVPGFAALNKGGDARITSVSCGSAGNCSAGGLYTDGTGGYQAFVVSETNGTWGKAEEVPGTAALNKDGNAAISSVSCGSAGNCSAGGSYAASGALQAFVVSETEGTWGKAEEVPGTAALNKDGDAGITSVSCASAGNCSAGGSYRDGASHVQVLVVQETKGTWGKAEEVPGTAALNKDGNAGITSVSCGSAGNCSAGGYYFATNVRGEQAFVASETSGTWRKAEEVPGTAALNQGGYAQVNSLSCTSAGHCGGGGYYTGGSGHGQAFVVGES